MSERIDDNAKHRALANKRPAGTGPRPIYEIAKEIRENWGIKINFAAKPYLDAMSELTLISDAYYAEDAVTQVVYFLSNANTWRGEVAKRIKKELNAMVEQHRKKQRR